MLVLSNIFVTCYVAWGLHEWFFVGDNTPAFQQIYLPHKKFHIFLICKTNKNCLEKIVIYSCLCRRGFRARIALEWGKKKKKCPVKFFVIKESSETSFYASPSFLRLSVLSKWNNDKFCFLFYKASVGIVTFLLISDREQKSAVWEWIALLPQQYICYLCFYCTGHGFALSR